MRSWDIQTKSMLTMSHNERHLILEPCDTLYYITKGLTLDIIPPALDGYIFLTVYICR